MTKLPAIFFGHGNPMNAIENNIYTKNWAKIAESFPTPKAILCISAHYETYGSLLTNNKKQFMILAVFQKSFLQCNIIPMETKN